MGRRRGPAPGLAAALRRHVEQGRLLRSGDDVLVALSGGLDSTVLLHLLRFPLTDLGLRLRAAHFDHGMRSDSAADAAWVRGLGRAWDVPVTVGRAAAPLRSEAAARRARYAFLDSVAGSGAWILTAHHRDDQAETVLFRLARGTGLRGLRGIAPRRGRILRPLLPFTRADLAGYARAVGLAWREDRSNRELRFARNRLRHRVIPELERVSPGAAGALAEVAARARRAEAAWEQALAALEEHVVVHADDAGLTLARDVLLSYHPHLRARVLRHVLRRYGTTPGRAGTQAALEFISSGSSGRTVPLRGGVRLERDFDRIRVVAPGAAADAGTDADRGGEGLVIPGPGPGRGRVTIGGRSFLVAWGDGAHATGGEGVVVPAPSFPLSVRGWRPGDRIRFPYGSKKLKKLFTERRLDRHARRRTPVLADAAGRVLWVVGSARAAGVKQTGDGLEIAVKDAE